MPARILIVEDEEALSVLLKYNLEAEGFEVDSAFSAEEAEIHIEEQLPDMIVLDWMLPGLSGIELCRRLRANKQTAVIPVLMLTARGEEAERVRGLDTGADDYMVKPFEIDELEARVRVLLRRSAGNSTSKIKLGPLILDISNNTLSANSAPVDVSARELNVLTVMMMSQDRIIPKIQIVDSLSTFDSEISDNAIEQIVSRLRKRLHSFGINIRTARGLGYYLDSESIENE